MLPLWRKRMDHSPASRKDLLFGMPSETPEGDGAGGKLACPRKPRKAPIQSTKMTRRPPKALLGSTLQTTRSARSKSDKSPQRSSTPGVPARSESQPEER